MEIAYVTISRQILTLFLKFLFLSSAKKNENTFFSPLNVQGNFNDRVPLYLLPWSEYPSTHYLLLSGLVTQSVKQRMIKSGGRGFDSSLPRAVSHPLMLGLMFSGKFIDSLEHFNIHCRVNTMIHLCP